MGMNGGFTSLLKRRPEKATAMMTPAAVMMWPVLTTPLWGGGGGKEAQEERGGGFLRLARDCDYTRLQCDNNFSRSSPHERPRVGVALQTVLQHARALIIMPCCVGSIEMRCWAE